MLVVAAANQDACVLPWERYWWLWAVGMLVGCFESIIGCCGGSGCLWAALASVLVGMVGRCAYRLLRGHYEWLWKVEMFIDDPQSITRNSKTEIIINYLKHIMNSYNKSR